MNSKETLKKLHKRFPLMSLDELFDILDCYIETSPYLTTNCWEKVYYSKDANNNINKLITPKPENSLIAKITYNDDSISNTNTASNRQLATDHSVR